MKTRQEKDILMERIIALEIKQTRELVQLKEQFHQSMAALNPLYLIKKTFRDVISSPDIKSDVLHGAVNLTSQFLSRNTLLGTFQKPIKKLLGNVLMTVLQKISPAKPKLP